MSAQIHVVPLRTRAGFATIAVVSALLAGCSSAAPSPTGPFQPFTSDPRQPFSLIVANIDGPPVDVFVDGARAAHADCAPGGMDVPPEVVSTAPFPWHIDVRRADGTVLGTFVANDTMGPLTLLVRTDGATLIPRGQNAGQAPAASCAP